MGIRDVITKLVGSGDQKKIVNWEVDPYEGIDFIFDRQVGQAPEKFALNHPFFALQLSYLKGLHEQGLAEKNANGYTVLSANVPDLDEDFAELFELPPAYAGSYALKIEGNTSQASFTVSVSVQLPGGDIIPHYRLSGPFLALTESEMYRLSPAEFKALSAISDHQKLAPDKKGEYENNWLIFQLQLAQKAGMKLDMAHFNNLELLHPEAVGVAVEEQANGDLKLTPTYGGGIELEDIQRRLGQVGGNEHCILRVKDKFVLLDEDRLEATEEILTNRRIPKEQVSVFLKSPTAYLNAALIDLDTGFSLRLHGAERFVHKYFGDIEESGIDWFKREGEILFEPISNALPLIQTEQSFTEFKDTISSAQSKAADSVEYEGRAFDIRNPDKVTETLSKAEARIKNSESEFIHPEESIPDAAVVSIDDNDEEANFESGFDLDGLNPNAQQFEQGNLKRLPFPHQLEGINWLLSHFERAKALPAGSGSLLADDMGLGKTYMTLTAIEEWFRRCKERNEECKPVMIVAPLSLLENWQAEVEATFKESPFSDIVVLQGAIDLKRFKVKGAQKETRQQLDEDGVIGEEDQIRYSLKIGRAYGPDRLDVPARLVLTTYQALRDYQFSLSRVDWSVVAFDEAQNIKNPNALVTRAAKALKSDFKLLATGTPVENSLKDFWCLMDTAAPGAVGSWQSFRSRFISPILAADAESVRATKVSVGKELRNLVGGFMLRRTKEQKLEGLPDKYIFSGDRTGECEDYLPVLAAEMKGSQLSQYNEIVDKVASCPPEMKLPLILPSLHKLKVTSIHPAFVDAKTFPKTPNELTAHAKNSNKIQSMLAVIEQIKNRNEKVIIFAISKSIQAYVSVLISTLFKVSVDVVNGDTKAVSGQDGADTRKGIIDRFQSEEGFGAIIMSPVAAGVGLTVTGANNVIHLERHWNPAKEAQATDRVYRIGQKRDVNVYIPISLHPEVHSFDVQLNTLLSNKTDLSDAVVARGAVEVDDFSCF